MSVFLSMCFLWTDQTNILSNLIKVEETLVFSKLKLKPNLAGVSFNNKYTFDNFEHKSSALSWNEFEIHRRT